MRNKFSRFFSFFLSLALLAGLIVPAAAAESIGNAVEMAGVRVQNASTHNYKFKAIPVKSYLGETNGKPVRVEYTGSKLLYEFYETDGSVLKSGQIRMELQEFGGFFFGQTYNFAVYGRHNLKETADAEVLRIVKYDKEMQRLDAVSFYGENTYKPFESGSLRMAETAGRLYIHTCHEMIKSEDGFYHQANMYYCINEDTMEKIDSFTGLTEISSYGCVSQSFNQFIVTDGTYVFRADHGDAYPRGISLTGFSVSAATAQDTVSTLPITFAGPVGANSTGASLGGMALSGSRVLLAGSIDDQTGTYIDSSDESGDQQMNIFVISAAKTLADAENKLIYITSYGENAGIRVGTPHLTALGNGASLLMWEETSSGKTMVRAAVIDENGALKTEIFRIHARLSDCAPQLFSDGYVYWYVGTDVLEVLYRLDPSDIGSYKYLIHTWDDGVVTTPVGCETKGVRTYTCLDCGETKTEDIEPLGHSWSFWYANADGVTHTRVCSRNSSHIQTEAHNYGEFMPKTPATCTEPGYCIAYCVDCRLEKTEMIQPLNHKWGPWTRYNAQRHQRVCLNDANHTEFADHVWIREEKTPPTCEKEGIVLFVCGDCGAERTETAAALGHRWDEGVVSTQPNCTEEGVRIYTCKVCGKTKEEPIAPKGHNYKGVATAPTCTENGFTVYTCVDCGDHYIGDPTPPAGHQWNAGTVTAEPGCTEEGVATFTCTVCGAEKTEPVAPVGHRWDAGTPTTPATCTEQGEMTYTCTVCGETKKEVIPPNGHSWDDGAETAPPTCEVIGLLTRTCTACGVEKIESIPAIGHNYQETAVAPACTEDGYTEHRCLNCGDVYSSDPVAALGHSWGDAAITEPTCTGTGTETYTCERCGETKTEVLPAAGHVWGAGEEIPAPTCTETGALHHTCTVCGEEETVILPANGHNFGEWTVTIAPTETREGSEERVCTVCGAWETRILPVLEPEILYGDVNHDGFVSSADARLVLRRAVGLETYVAGSPEYLACDVNHDGYVTAADARLVLRAAVGLGQLS